MSKLPAAVLQRRPLPDSAATGFVPFVNGEGTDICTLSPQAAMMCFFRVRQWRLRADSGAIVFQIAKDKRLICSGFSFVFPAGVWDDPPGDEVALVNGYDWIRGAIAWNDGTAFAPFIKSGSAWDAEEGDERLEPIALTFGQTWDWHRDDEMIPGFGRKTPAWAQPELSTRMGLEIAVEEIGPSNPLLTNQTIFWELAEPGKPFFATLTANSDAFPADSAGVLMTMDARLEPASVWPWGYADDDPRGLNEDEKFNAQPRWNATTGERLSDAGEVIEKPIIP